MTSAALFAMVAVLAGTFAFGDPAACSGEDDTCPAGLEDSALLQVGGNHSHCAHDGQDPHHHHNGQCCHGLHKVKHKWSGDTCRFLCKHCSSLNEDTHRYCGGHCGGCHTGGDELLPCCAGLTEKKVGGKFICVANEVQSLISSSCAKHGEDPYAHGKNHQCCHHAHTPLYKVKSKWPPSHHSHDSHHHHSTCSTRCMQCTGFNGDTHRYCGSHCGGCHHGGSEVVPCCPGLTEHLVGKKFKCL